jgi:hypothetical protein
VMPNMLLIVGWYYASTHLPLRILTKRRVYLPLQQQKLGYEMTYKGRIKKINLPPTNRKGVETYLRRRGYRINPSLEGDKHARFTFDKPLPNGGRLHGDFHDGKKKMKLCQHIDSRDPYRHPIGHIMLDCTARIRNSCSTIPKMTKRKRKKRTFC